MTDLHPEALIDRAAQGTLDPGDRARVRAHLAECASCRLELSVRRAATRHTRVARDDAAMLERLAGAAIVRAAAPANDPAPRMSSTTGFALGVVAGIVLLLMLSAAVRFGRATMTDDESPRSQAEAIGVLDSAGGAAIERAPEPTAVAPAREMDAQPEPPAEQPPVPPSSLVQPRDAEPNRRAASRKPEPPPEEVDERRAAPLEAVPEPVAPEASSASELFSRATAASRRGETDTALALFSSLRERFPVSREARTSWVLGGRLLLGRGDADAALSSFDRYLDGSARGPLAPEAMAGRAKALDALGRTAPARAQWQTIVDRFPRSSAAVEAKRKLAGGTEP